MKASIPVLVLALALTGCWSDTWTAYGDDGPRVDNIDVAEGHLRGEIMGEMQIDHEAYTIADHYANNTEVYVEADSSERFAMPQGDLATTLAGLYDVFC